MLSPLTRRSFVLAAAASALPWAARGAAAEPWWQRATGYQIYPASFCDGNGDGIGDLPGILSKLDHLADLGVGFIWLSPVYASPMVDNGYDIADYQAINPTFGTLADMDRLIAEARRRHIGIVMDLVVNHTSDQHAWFRQARADRRSPYRDYYLWREAPPPKGAPDDLGGIFGGPAWTRDTVSGEYYFHQFAPQQPDLNWAHAPLRQDIYRMMRWWLDRGVAGFRMDVIDLIGKDVARGVLSDGPHLHDYLQEMNRSALAGRDGVTVGEAWSATPATAPLYSDPARHELSMVFQFEQVTRFWDEKLGKWRPKPVDLPTLKAIFAKWQAALAERGWNSLFWSNHDLPRAVSRYGDEGEQRVASARMLATVLHLMRGTPFVYQGEEIGMTNAGFTRIGQYRDLETLNFHRIQLEAGIGEEAFLAGARANSRDNARTPMQWTAAPGAGFTTGTPWIEVNGNHRDLNVERDRADPQGVFRRYQELIALRRRLPIIRHGSFHLIAPDDEAVFAYERRLGDARLVVIANFTRNPARLELSAADAVSGADLFSGRRRRLAGALELGPYETVAVLRKGSRAS